METSAASTIHLRPLRGDDLEPVRALHTRANLADGIEQVISIEELHEDIDGERVTYEHDVRVAEVGGVIAGYAYTYHLTSETDQERCYVFGTVDPDHRGRGIGRALLAWAVERGTAQLRSSGSALPKFLRVNADDQLESAHRLHRRLGFTPVRWFEELIRPLDELPPRRDVPGVRVLPWDASRDEEILAAKNAAFADHWGSTPTPPDVWRQMVHGASGRPDLSSIAVDEDDRIVAHCLNQVFEQDEQATGRRDAWIENLGTLRPWRGRGVASALVTASLHAFAGAGRTHACIGVDADNPTGAARLYRALGFEPMRRSVTSEIRVA